MSHQSKVLFQSEAFKLVRKNKKDRLWYEVQYDLWQTSFSPEWRDTEEEVRDFFDPLRNKSGQEGTKWKFRNRKDAEQMYMLAVLKWS